MADPVTPPDEAIFEAARACRNEVSRHACLDSLCGSDHRLRGRVEVLLRAQAEAERFFGADPVRLAHGTAGEDAGQPAGSPADPFGQRIGPTFSGRNRVRAAVVSCMSPTM